MHGALFSSGGDSPRDKPEHPRAPHNNNNLACAWVTHQRLPRSNFFRQEIQSVRIYAVCICIRGPGSRSLTRRNSGDGPVFFRQE
jgi:hypothetical protein